MQRMLARSFVAGKFMSFITPSGSAGCRCFLADSQTLISIKFVAIYDDDFYVFSSVFPSLRMLCLREKRRQNIFDCIELVI